MVRSLRLENSRNGTIFEICGYNDECVDHKEMDLRFLFLLRTPDILVRYVERSSLQFSIFRMPILLVATHASKALLFPRYLDDR